MSEQIRTYTNKKSAFINNCTARCGIFAFWMRYIHVTWATELVTGHVSRNNQEEYIILHLTMTMTDGVIRE